MKTTGRILSLAAAGIFVVGAANYSKNKEVNHKDYFNNLNIEGSSISTDKNLVDVPEPEEAPSNYEEIFVVNETNSNQIKNIDYKAVIRTYLNSLSDNNISEESRRALLNDYIDAIYMLLYNSGYSMDVFDSELRTMVEMSKNPSCVATETWNKDFKYLILTAGKDCESLFEMFLPYAEYYVNNSSLDKGPILKRIP